MQSTASKQSNRCMTWNDLMFWRTGKWTEIQKILKAHSESVTPPLHRVFRPFAETPLDRVRVVFIFPEPYSTEGIADGLALSHSQDKEPYLFTAFREELQADYSVKIKRTDLKTWARRGVLLWNARPTTLVGHSRGHRGLGWEILTKEVLETVYLCNPETVFVFVGQEVYQMYSKTLPEDSIRILCPMPVPPVFKEMEGDGVFQGCRIFSKINSLLKGNYKNKICWET